MKGINIFIAGAKDLKLQRERLKVLATDMNNIFYPTAYTIVALSIVD